MVHSGAVVFLGPSLDADTARSVYPGAILLPPARCGDLIEFKQIRPRVVVLIDGEFEHTAAVWHKEILDLLHYGVSVIGSSSMGALRAAELHSFGMIGVGEVFRRYRDAEILDDDEVALHYVRAPWGYMPLSEPMVNCRVTIESALAAGAITCDEADRLETTAKALFFQDRTWDRILAAGFSEHVRKAMTDHYHDQKREDAIAALELAQSPHATGPVVDPVPVQPSVFLRKLRGEAVCRIPNATQGLQGPDLSCLDTAGEDSAFLYERLAVMLANAACLAPSTHAGKAEAGSVGRHVLAITRSERFRAAMSPDRLIRFRAHVNSLFETGSSSAIGDDAYRAYAVDQIARFWSLIDWVAEQRGFTADGARLSQISDDFRKSRHLEKASDTRRWLRARGMNEDAFVEFLRAQDRVMVLCDTFNMQLLGIGEQIDDSVHWFQEAVALVKHGVAAAR